MKLNKCTVKFTRVFMLFAIFAFFVANCVLLSACSEQHEEQTKYDVAIRVACSDGSTYTFPVGEDEKHVTIPYDGIERTYWVDSYNLPDHPRWSDKWFSPSGEGANVFDTSLGYVDQMYYEDPPENVCEVGEYFYCVHADATSDIWNFRTIYLYIIVE